jgi:hypothetical protein
VKRFIGRWPEHGRKFVRRRGRASQPSVHRVLVQQNDRHPIVNFAQGRRGFRRQNREGLDRLLAPLPPLPQTGQRHRPAVGARDVVRLFRPADCAPLVKAVGRDQPPPPPEQGCAVASGFYVGTSSVFTPGENRLAFGVIDRKRKFVYGKTVVYLEPLGRAQ